MTKSCYFMCYFPDKVNINIFFMIPVMAIVSQSFFSFLQLIMPAFMSAISLLPQKWIIFSWILIFNSQYCRRLVLLVHHDYRKKSGFIDTYLQSLCSHVVGWLPDLHGSRILVVPQSSELTKLDVEKGLSNLNCTEYSHVMNDATHRKWDEERTFSKLITQKKPHGLLVVDLRHRLSCAGPSSS